MYSQSTVQSNARYKPLPFPVHKQYKTSLNHQNQVDAYVSMRQNIQFLPHHGDFTSATNILEQCFMIGVITTAKVTKRW